MNKRRASFTVGLTYNTTEAQLHRCISRITEMINQNPEVLADDTVVAFNSFQDSSLEISVLFYTRATSFSAFQKIKEQVNYGIMKIVEEEGASFACKGKIRNKFPKKPTKKGAFFQGSFFFSLLS